MTASDAVVLTKDGKPTHVVVPFERWEAIVAALGEVEDAQLARDAFIDPDNESLPWELARALASGANRVRVWREFRGLSREALAERAGLDLATIAGFETGDVKEGPVEAHSQLARALGCDVEDLLQPSP